MEAAADYLEGLIQGTLEEAPLLDVHRCFGAPGPSVGRGLPGTADGGRNLEAASCRQRV